MPDENLIAKYISPLSPLPTGASRNGSLTTPVACILFDVYGTLFISGSGDIGTAEKRTRHLSELTCLLERYHIPGTGRDLLDALFERIKNEHVRIRKTGIEHPEVDIVHIWKYVLGRMPDKRLRAFAAEFEMIANPVFPMPHLEDLLAACRRKGILMGIISNAQFYTPLLFEWFCKASFGKLGFSEDLLFFSYQYGQAKPSSFLFELAQNRLILKGINNRAVLYLGNDMLNDIYPADSVGFQTALFAGDARSLRWRKDDLRCTDLTPDLIVTDLNQIVDALPDSN